MKSMKSFKTPVPSLENVGIGFVCAAKCNDSLFKTHILNCFFAHLLPFDDKNVIVSVCKSLSSFDYTLLCFQTMHL